MEYLITSDPAQGKKVEKAFKAFLRKEYKPSEIESVHTFFEHGHWWARVHLKGHEAERTFDAVDASRDGADYIDFEEV